MIAFGTIIGHGLCTAGAVIGGRWLSTKISVKYSQSSLFPPFARFHLTLSSYFADSPHDLLPSPSPSGLKSEILVTLIGAFLFLVFSLLYFREGYTYEPETPVLFARR